MKKQIDYKEKNVPFELWGKDHFSTLGYVETRVVDYNGYLDNRNLRCNPRLHSRFVTGLTTGGAKYPTRLKDDAEATNHDDFSCIEDFEAYGLLTHELFETDELKFRNNPSFYGQRTIKITLTEKGIELCAELRSHKARGGVWSNFEPSVELAEKLKLKFSKTVSAN